MTGPPPPEPSISKLRQAYRFTKDPFTFLSQVRAEHGDLFAVHLPGLGPVVFLCSAPLLNEIYKMPEESIVAGEIRHKLVGYLTGSRASISIDGGAYSDRRRVMAPFFAGKSLYRHTDAIRGFAEDMVSRWPRDRVFPLRPSFNEITLETICRILYGPSGNGAAGDLVRLSGDFLDAFRSKAVHTPFLHWNLGRWSPWGRFLAARRKVVEALGREIRAREASPGGSEDLLSAFLASGVERDVVAEEVLSLLVGGAETTSTVLSWTFVGLLSNRPYLERLRRELEEVLGGRPIESADVRELPYLDAVIQEGMRHQSVGPFAGPRLAKKAIELGGYSIPAGTVIVQCLSEVGRSDVFPHPDRFDPENFFGREIKMKDWVPFGGGSRICTGMGLAKLELAVVAATVVQRADLELGSGSLRPVQKGLTFQPENDLLVRFRGAAQTSLPS